MGQIFFLQKGPWFGFTRNGHSFCVHFEHSRFFFTFQRFILKIVFFISLILSHNNFTLTHGQRQYICISEPGQLFRSHMQFVLYRPDIGQIKQTLNRTSRCNKVDPVRLQVEFTFTKGSEVRGPKIKDFSKRLVKSYLFIFWPAIFLHDVIKSCFQKIQLSD